MRHSSRWRGCPRGCSRSPPRVRACASPRSMCSATAIPARPLNCGSTSASANCRSTARGSWRRSQRAARLPGLIGWIDGSGLEPFVAQLCGTRGLPRFIGNPVEASAPVREPQRFFALLDALDIPHPAVAFTRPADARLALMEPAEAQGWLVKHADGCGGTHIEPATTVSDSRVPAKAYFQRAEQRPLAVGAVYRRARPRARARLRRAAHLSRWAICPSCMPAWSDRSDRSAARRRGARARGDRRALCADRPHRHQ